MRIAWSAERFDLLHIHRFADERTLAAARAAKAAGAAVVWDNDDDDATIPRSVAAYRFHGGLRWACGRCCSGCSTRGRRRA